MFCPLEEDERRSFLKVDIYGNSKVHALFQKGNCHCLISPMFELCEITSVQCVDVKFVFYAEQFASTYSNVCFVRFGW